MKFWDFDKIFLWMKNNKREFEKFRDSEFRTNFWQDFNQIVRNINFTSLGAVVDYNKIKKVYGFGNNDCYKLAFIRLMNKYTIQMMTKIKIKKEGV